MFQHWLTKHIYKHDKHVFNQSSHRHAEQTSQLSKFELGTRAKRNSEVQGNGSELDA